MVSRRGLGGRMASLGAVTLLLLATACSGGSSGEGFAASTGEAGAAVAFDFALDTLDGREVRLSDSAGKVRLIDFWATWCVPCREEIPMLNELQASYADRGFEVLAISDEDAGIIREFVDEHGVEYLNLVGSEEVSQAYGVLGLPAAFLVDGEGQVIDTFLGPKPRRVLVKKIEALLEPTPST